MGVLFDHFKRFLESYRISPSIRATIALSGGPDSTALAALSSRWCCEWMQKEASDFRDDYENPFVADVGSLSFQTYSLLHQKDPLIDLKLFQRDPSRPLAVVVDHGLRPESQQEAIAVSKGAGASNLEVLVKTVDWGRAKPEKGKAMALARQKRYELLYEACIAANSPVLLTGHHLGDQMETFVSRFFGASGVDGLSGMQPASLIRPGCPGPLFNMHSTIDHPILLLRPFLGVEKSELVRYCEDAGLSYVKDPTNVDSFFARARVRKVLASAPSVAEDIAAVQRSCTDARKLQEDSAFVLLQKTWICNEGSLCDGGRAVFDVGPFVGSTRWVVRRLMLVVLQIIARKEYPPRSGIDSLVNALLSGRLTCNFDFGGCLVQPVKKSKGSQIAITKSSTRRGVLKEMVDGF